jgi:hypothetical protein
MAVTAPGSDLWVLLVRKKALDQTQNVSPQAQKVSLMGRPHDSDHALGA